MTGPSTFDPTSRRHGEVLVLAGGILLAVGIVVYCAACFASDSEADLGAIVLDGAIPVARLGLLAIGAGTLTWIFGSFLHLDRPRGATGPRGTLPAAGGGTDVTSAAG